MEIDFVTVMVGMGLFFVLRKGINLTRRKKVEDARVPPPVMADQAVTDKRELIPRGPYVA